jgi:hypothetical protein
MGCELPRGISPGQIFCHARYYLSAGEWKRKYLLVLADAPGGDVIYRLLTNRAHGRPKQPPCFHGDPYPGFYLGLLGGPLTADSWLDLQRTEDYDGHAFLTDIESGALHQITTLPPDLLCPALGCVANADDTTREQEHCIRDARAAVGCP